MDDKEEVEKSVQETEKTFLKRKEPIPPSGKGKKAIKSKQAGKKKEAGPSVSMPIKDKKTDLSGEKKVKKEDKNQIEGQVSLF